MAQTRLKLMIGLVMFLGVAAIAPAKLPVPATFPQYEITHIPFAPGEAFEYSVSWNGIPAADGKAWVERTVGKGRDFYSFYALTKTCPVIDILFHLDDSGSSTVDARTLLPLGHVILRRENERRLRFTTQFDHAAKIVTCVRERFDKGTVDRVRMSYHFAFDRISAPYFLRSLNWKVGDHRWIEIIESNTRFLFDLRAVGKEEISVPAGKFHALKMRPLLLELSPHKKKELEVKEAEMWVSDDPHHIPLRLKTASFIGYIYIDLAKFKLGSGARPPSLCD